MKSKLEKVREFHKAFNQKSPDYPSIPEETVVNLREKLVEEEFGETINALNNKDLIEVADGLGDTLVVLYGTVDQYGLECYDESYKEDEFENFINPNLYIDYVSSGEINNDVQDFLSKWNSFKACKNITEISNLLDYLIYKTYKISYNLSIPICKVFDEIHDSNMSKLGEDGKPIVNGETIGYREGEEGYRSDLPIGKILKGPNFRKPDLKKVLFAGS